MSEERARVKVTHLTREELEAQRDAILAKYPDLEACAREQVLIGDEWGAWAELGQINWLLGGDPE